LGIFGKHAAKFLDGGFFQAETHGVQG
jgi:hypothetical protein